MTQVSESDYKTVQESQNPKVRKEFCDAVDFEERKRYVRDVFYQETNDFGHVMSCVPGIFFIDKSIINVYSKAFELRYEEFLSVLLDHEVQHAIMFKEKPFIYWKRIFEAQNYASKYRNNLRSYFKGLDEIPARANEIAMRKTRGLQLGTSMYTCSSMADYLKKTLTEGNYLRNEAKPKRDIREDINGILCSSAGDDFLRNLLENPNLERDISSGNIYYKIASLAGIPPIRPFI